MYDMIIRGGTVIDGTGAPERVADVAIDRGRIVQIAKIVGRAREEIDATGQIVTPGFVDIHTHYDGQAIWSDHLTPSSQHGVTTVVAGNCGVGFAPCRQQDQELLVNVMEGVEDIPEVVMTAGLKWDWETFPEFLDAIERRPHDIDIAVQLPHSALRVYVMGERGANREAATSEDLAKMKVLAREAIEAGAIGFATSRIFMHRRGDGQYIPSFNAAEEELAVIASALSDAGRGVLQFVLGGTPALDTIGEIEMVRRLVKRSGRPASFGYGQDEKNPESWRELFAFLNQSIADGYLMRAQVLPRSTGMILGHNLSVTPFSLSQTYIELSRLPLTQKISELRKPEVRQKILSEQPIDTVPLIKLGQNFERMFPLDPDHPNYEPAVETSIASQARRQGVDAKALAYDLLLERDGNAMFYVALGNYAYGHLDHMYEVMQQKSSVFGLGDGGAHYGMICDSSYPTFVLTHWTRDRLRDQKLPLSVAINALSQKPAEAVGLNDRGILALGYKADINVIDYDNLTLGSPYVLHDLPAGGRRLTQVPKGFTATIVSGQVIYRDGVATGVLPGKLVRGQQDFLSA